MLDILDFPPLWVIGPALALAMIAAEEIGYRVRHRVDPPGVAAGKESEQGVGGLVGAALALLGLLLAFTFSLAQDRLDQRRRLVMDEANAVETSYLRYQALPEPERSQLSRLAADYANLRGRVFNAQQDREALREHVARTKDFQAEIWAAVLRGLERKPDLIEPVMESTNQMFELTARRVALVDVRIPASIRFGLLMFTVLSAFFTGYGLALPRRHRLAIAGLFLLVSLVFMLVLDLDRPYSGTVRVSQAPMIRAAEAIAQMEAAKRSPAG